MPMRFLIPTDSIGAPLKIDGEIVLDTERAHYLVKVMRAKSGDQINCFDGQGTTFDAEVIEAHTRQCRLRIAAIAQPVEFEPRGLQLGLAVLKGQAMDRALQQATELGVDEIHLMLSQRSNVHLADARKDNKLTHWRKIVAAACEQSGHVHLPQLHTPQTMIDVLAQNRAKVAVLDMHGATLPRALERVPTLILIGPEGGWDDSELALFQQRGFDQYSIGPSTLRAETMPAVALALFQHLRAET